MTNLDSYSDDKIEAISMHSDFYKDVNGFRPRSFNWDNIPTEEIINMIDTLAAEGKIQREKEKEFENQKVLEFKSMLNRYTTEFGAADETQALQWYLDSLNEKFFSPQCVEQIVWRESIMFTEYGKSITQKLCNIIEANNAWEPY